jgi:hypothetical protein
MFCIQGVKMKRKWIIIVAGVICFTAIPFSSFISVSAQSINIGQAVVESTSLTATKTLEPGSIIHITPTPSLFDTNKERIIKVLHNLVLLANENYLSAGWLYCSGETQDFYTAQKSFPDGTPIPLKSTSHSWYRLDDAGKVLQAVEFQDTGNSLTSQFSLYQNGVWKNITLGTTSTQASYTLKLDNGIVESVNNLSESDTISMEFTSLNGANVVKIEKRYYYPKPTTFVTNDPRKYIGNAITQYIDQETGLITQTEQSNIKMDGTLEVTSRLYNEKCEKQPNGLSVYFNPPG